MTNHNNPCEVCGNYVASTFKQMNVQMDILNNALDRSLKVLEQKSGWIPVSERLPKGYCLFCDIDGDVFYGHIYDKKWWAEGQDDRIKNVIAWMPTPEPYKAERDG